MSTPATIHREIAKLWTERDFDGMHSLLHSDYSYMGGDGKEMTGGPDVALAIARMFANAFPDGSLEVRKVYTDGDVAVAEMVGRGTHGGEFLGIAPTGKPVEVVICNVIELRDGKVYREREYMDMLTIMTQLGAMNAPGSDMGANLCA